MIMKTKKNLREGVGKKVVYIISRADGRNMNEVTKKTFHNI